LKPVTEFLSDLLWEKSITDANLCKTFNQALLSDIRGAIPLLPGSGVGSLMERAFLIKARSSSIVSFTLNHSGSDHLVTVPIQIVGTCEYGISLPFSSEASAFYIPVGFNFPLFDAFLVDSVGKVLYCIQVTMDVKSHIRKDQTLAEGKMRVLKNIRSFLEKYRFKFVPVYASLDKFFEKVGSSDIGETNQFSLDMWEPHSSLFKLFRQRSEGE